MVSGSGNADWLISMFSSAYQGKVKEKQEPCPRADSTLISPPCFSTILLTMVSPSPVPLIV